MHPRRYALAALLVALPVVLGTTSAQAQFETAEQKCRGQIAKNGAKLAVTTQKTLAKCHKARNDLNKGIGADDDCNSVNNASDPKDKIGTAKDKLTNAATNKCEGTTPADVDYSVCPAPCFAEVGAIATFDDVADCIICIAEELVTEEMGEALGSPSGLPLVKIDAKCHAALAKNQGKYLKTVLGAHTKCQKGAEKNGATDTSACAAADEDKITNALGKTAIGISNACTVATLTNIDACGTTVNDLRRCVLDGIKAVGDTLFLRLYELAGAGTTTTTPSTSTSTTSTSTTSTSTSTTSTLTAFTWTEIYDLFSNSPTQSCAGSFCHIGQNAGGLMMPNAATAYANLVGVTSFESAAGFKRIDAVGGSAVSYLMYKLDGNYIGAPALGSGLQMPNGKPPFSQTVRDKIRAWIDTGAPNN